MEFITLFERSIRGCLQKSNSELIMSFTGLPFVSKKNDCCLNLQHWQCFSTGSACYSPITSTLLNFSRVDLAQLLMALSNLTLSKSGPGSYYESIISFLQYSLPLASTRWVQQNMKHFALLTLTQSNTEQ